MCSRALFSGRKMLDVSVFLSQGIIARCELSLLTMFDIYVAIIASPGFGNGREKCN